MAKPVVTDWGSEDEGSSDFEISDDEPAYEVERIIAQRNVDGTDQYLVKWTNFGDEDCTWEPAESFDQTLSISLWEEARARGDALDATELQDVELKMARRQADNEKQEAARQERNKKKLARKTSPDISNLADRPATVKEVASTKKAIPTTPSSASAKRKAPDSLQSASKAEPAKQNQDFYGLSDKPQTARRTTGTQMKTATGSHVGKPFRNLSHQNNAQKRRRQEPAPNINQIGTLRPVTELFPTHDVALNLPSGPRQLSSAQNVTQETFVESADGQLEQVTGPDPAIMSLETSAAESEGQEKARSEPHSHQQISHAVFRSAPDQNDGILHIRYGNEYFHYRWGELVVQMRMGSSLIGHVKVVGLMRPGEESSSLIAALLRTRENFVLGMTFEQEDAHDLEDYGLFEREVSAVGSLEPFDNAKNGFYRLLTFFNTHSKAVGVWRHESVPWIMIAYSSRAAAFIEKGFPTVSGGLAFIVCRRMPWRYPPHPTAQPLLPSRNASMDVSLQTELEFSGTTTPMEIDSRPTSALSAKANHISQPVPGVERTSSVAHPSDDVPPPDPRRVKATKETLGVQIQAVLKRTKPHGLAESIKAKSFEEKYGITYEYLTRIPATVRAPPGKGNFQRHLVRFFLAFNEDRKDEETELRNWLSTRTPAHMVFSAREFYSWDRYKEFLVAADHVGIILIHEDFLTEAFGFMSGLAKRIRRDNIQIFRVSLERPLYNLSLRHFERILPSGLMLLITESSIIANARRIANLLEWFLKASKGKKNWRLFFQPYPEQYLRDLCETELSEDDRNAHIQSLLHLKTLERPFEKVSSPLASPDESEPSASYILAPLRLSVYSKDDKGTSLATNNTDEIAERDAKLLDFFCGWSFSQVSHFRKFVAVTGHVSEELRKRNAHIEFLPLEEFEKVYISKQAETKLTTPIDSPMSPVVRGAVIKHA